MTDPKSLVAWSNAAFLRWCAKRGIDPATVTVLGCWAHTWVRGDEALPLPPTAAGQQKTGGEGDVKQRNSSKG